jgi:hypothetical protein
LVCATVKKRKIKTLLGLVSYFGDRSGMRDERKRMRDTRSGWGIKERKVESREWIHEPGCGMVDERNGVRNHGLVMHEVGYEIRKTRYLMTDVGFNT